MGKSVELEAALADAAVTVEGHERTVKASLTLYELFQRSGSTQWVRRGKISKGLWLAGDYWILRLPEREGGEYTWLWMKPMKTPANLRSFYKGGESPESWGPARKFTRLGQETPVAYDLAGQSWQVVDVGAVEAEVSGSCPIAQTGDRLYTVTSNQDTRWMVYLDARTGEAKGTGGLFVGETFDPEAKVEALL